ncbi:MAG: transport between ER and Golgi ATPase protein [Alyxoria varia]|nr:MAG: transport between ER and Golgi ATPase protein [Alyxoria varia]
MFNRNPPQQPHPSREPGRPDPRAHPPPRQPPQYRDDPRMGNGYQEKSHPPRHPQQGYPPQRAPAPSNRTPAIQMQPTKAPDNTYTFTNLVAVSPEDIPPSRDGLDVYVLVNDGFVFTARPLNGFPRGQIGLSEVQRTWAEIAFSDTVKVHQYDPFADGTGNNYLASMDMEIGFAGRKSTDVPYDQDELNSAFVRVFSNHIFAPGQLLLMDHKSVPLRFAVRTVTIGDLSMEKQSDAPGTSNPRTRGIVTPQTSMNFFKDARFARDMKLKASNKRPAANSIVQPDFKFESMGIGGLDTEFQTIFRRAFASRIFPPGIVEKLDIQHVKGVLLHGPPGTGKTLIARKIGQMLNAREPKVVNGPEVLNKFVGQSEENIRKLFGDAEKESKEKGDESGLHIIIFDELDAVCKQRGSTGGGTGVGDSVVNQLLSKLDGVDQLNNVLLIGMTNRMDMIDDALLRPGRLEVHVEISLPDEHGRVQILGIHTQKQRSNGTLDVDVNIEELASLTKNFSGAEISGLVRAATSYAFSRHIKVGTMASVSEDVQNMKVNRADFLNALNDVHAAFGVSEQGLERCVEGGLLPYSSIIPSILKEGNGYIGEVREDPSTSLLSVLLHGPPSSGKTALAANIALGSDFPLVKLVSPADMKGFNEMSKVQYITRIFTDAHKSSLSIIVIDNIEKIIDWSPIGPRFSNAVVVSLAVNLQEKPPKGRRLLVLATTSQYSVMRQLDLMDVFDHKIAVPNVSTFQELDRVLELEDTFQEESERQKAIGMLSELAGQDGRSQEVGVGIKRVLAAVRQARRSADNQEAVFAEKMQHAIEDVTMSGA